MSPSSARSGTAARLPAVKQTRRGAHGKRRWEQAAAAFCLPQHRPASSQAAHTQRNPHHTAAQHNSQSQGTCRLYTGLKNSSSTTMRRQLTRLMPCVPALLIRKTCGSGEQRRSGGFAGESRVTDWRACRTLHRHAFNGQINQPQQNTGAFGCPHLVLPRLKGAHELAAVPVARVALNLAAPHGAAVCSHRAGGRWVGCNKWGPGCAAAVHPSSATGGQADPTRQAQVGPLQHRLDLAQQLQAAWGQQAGSMMCIGAPPW